MDGAAAYLSFNPAYVQVVSMSSGTTLPVIIQSSYDNTAGSINYAAGNFSSPHPSGNFTLVTINFIAVAQSPSVTLTFNNMLPRKSDVTFGGYSVINHTANGIVTITNYAALNGRVTLQGRPIAPDMRWVTPLNISLTIPGQSLPSYTFAVTTDNSGYFSIGSLPPGTYDVRIKNSHTLQNKLTVTLAVGNNAIDFGTLLEGDANNDNFVSLVDFSILTSSFGNCQGVTGYDDRADFNEDQCVSVLDFSLMATNFSQMGTTAMKRTQSLSPAYAGNIQLAIEPATVSAIPGQIFSMNVQVKAGKQQVDAAQASLDFNPALVRVRRLISGTALPLNLQSEFDNTAGTVDFSAGTFSNFPSGTFMLVTVEFESLMPTTGTNLAFHFGLPRETNVTFGGKSGLGLTNGGRIVTPITTAFTSNANNDGRLLELSETSNIGGTLDSAATTFNLGDDATRKQYRSILSFNTASLPDNAVITSVVLKVRKQGIVGGGNPVTVFQGFMVDIKNGSFSTFPALQALDFQAAASVSYGPFLSTPVNNWYNITLTGGKTYINKLAINSGLTQIRLRFKLDDNNNAIANYLSLYSGNAPTASRPQLVITYILP